MGSLDSIRLTNDQITSILDWIDKIPLTRQKLNLGRDFSDAVLLAEVVQHSHPKLVDLHNYPTTSAPKQKMTNWITISKKVLEWLGVRLTEDDLTQLVQGNR